MKITNKAKLPQPIVDAVTNDPYDSGPSDFSATSLIRPPYMMRLEKDNQDKIKVDVLDRIWALFGQAVHTVLERSNGDYTTEKRLYAGVDKYLISGQVDVLFKDGLIQDYKVISAWSVVFGPKPEWIQQLNTLAYLVDYNEHKVSRLQIVAIIRDWNKRRSQQEDNYPKDNVAVIDIPLWNKDKTHVYLVERCGMHNRALMAKSIHDVPPCSKDDMWQHDDTWAVKENGKKRALRVLKSKDDAEEYIHNICKPNQSYNIEFRPGQRTRCAGYCTVAEFCPNYQEYLRSSK